MSSFVSLRPTKKSLQIGNPTFRLLLRKMRDERNLSPSLAQIIEANPIADCIGLLNLSDIPAEDIRSFVAFTEGLLIQPEDCQLTEAGFNMHQDLIRFVEEVKTQLAVLT